MCWKACGFEEQKYSNSNRINNNNINNNNYYNNSNIFEHPSRDRWSNNELLSTCLLPANT